MTFTQFHRVDVGESSLPVLLQKLLDCTADSAQERIDIGSVYLEGLRVIDPKTPLIPGQILRVHTQPKRYDVSSVFNPHRVIYENCDFIIFDKPHGVPVHATLDNRIENAHFQLERIFGHRLFVTHRLDIPTGGLLLFAKTKEFQVRFNRLLQNKKTQKVYEALTDKPVSTGKHVHYMEKNRFQPKRLHSFPADKSQLCQLEVITCESLTDQRFRITMNLLTGRTQQIRAQLSTLGAPICGDTLYGSTVAPLQPQSICLIATRLAFVEAGNKQWDFYRPNITP